MPTSGELAGQTAEAVARQSYGKLVAYLAARTRDVAMAEDALSDAFAAALADWPNKGIPERPEAWLVAVAQRKFIDATRKRRHGEAAAPHVQLMAEELAACAGAASDIPDGRLALMFACAHPAIDPAIRAPLILQTILGFDAATIASAFLIAPAAMGQRLVRAKTKIRQAGIPFRVPERSELGDRLEPVLEAIYAAYAEGWSDPARTELRSRNLAEEGLWLARLVVSLLPQEPEALGLLSLMLYAEARSVARRDENDRYVPLAEQDTALWDSPMIEEAEALLRRASAAPSIGRYQLEAAIQSAHVVRRVSGKSDWPAIEKLYAALFIITGSPVIAINQAVAVAETKGLGDALAMLDSLSDDPRLTEYQPYWAARADLLARNGAFAEADRAYQRAIGLEPDSAVRDFLLTRKAELRGR